MINPYKILNINENATQEEIKIAFRKKAKETHPDLNGNSKILEERFKEIAEAYAILSDEQRKKEYDLNKNIENTESYNSYVNKTMEDMIKEITEIRVTIATNEKKALSVMTNGLIWLFIGLAVTFFSYAAASEEGGTYFVMYGAIIFGGYQALKAFMVYSQIKESSVKFEKQVWENFGDKFSK